MSPRRRRSQDALAHPHRGEARRAAGKGIRLSPPRFTGYAGEVLGRRTGAWLRVCGSALRPEVRVYSLPVVLRASAFVSFE